MTGSNKEDSDSLPKETPEHMDKKCVCLVIGNFLELVPTCPMLKEHFRTMQFRVGDIRVAE